jgi:hypothetical protein
MCELGLPGDKLLRAAAAEPDIVENRRRSCIGRDPMLKVIRPHIRDFSVR